MKLFLATLAVCLLFIGCASTPYGEINRHAETDQYHAFYTVTWPADASTSPTKYVTTVVDGRAITSVPVETETNYE